MSSVTCSQIWLSSFVDDCQNTVLTKLGKKKTLARTLLVVSDLFWWRILAILSKTILKKNILSQIPWFFEKEGHQKSNFLIKFCKYL
jgi:hypothetical protein